MGQVIFYDQKLAEAESKLEQFSAKIDDLSEQYGLKPLDVIGNLLEDAELDDYIWLQERHEKLKRWEAVDDARKN